MVLSRPIATASGPTAGWVTYVRRRPVQEKMSGQGCNTDRSTLKPSSLASVEVNYWKNALGQGWGLGSGVCGIVEGMSFVSDVV